MTPIRIAPDSTSRSVYVRILRDTGFANTTPLVFNSAGLAASYVRDNGAAVAIPLVTLSGPTAAYASGGLVHVSNGVYRLDAPNAALVAGASLVSIIIAEATDIRAEALLVDLDVATGTRVASGEMVPANVLFVASEPDAAYGLMGAGMDYYAAGRFHANVAQIAGQSVAAAAAVTFPAAISSYAGADTAGTMTLLARVPATVPSAADNAAAVSNLPAWATWHTATQATQDVQQTSGLLGDLIAAIDTRASQASVTTLATANAAIGGNVDEMIAMTVGAGAERKFRSIALMNAPIDGGAFTTTDRETLAAARAAAEAAGGGGNGNGDVAVGHDYRGNDYRVQVAGVGVDDAVVQAWTAYPGGSLEAETRTTSPDGEWAAPLMLNVGTYRLIVSKSGAIRTINVPLEVLSAT